MNGGRKLSQWNLFVKKVYKDGKSKDSNYAFKQALQDASKRKSEMASMKSSPATTSSKKSRKSKTSRRTMSLAGGKRTRKNKSR
jgi:hypothetical protein